MSEIPPTRYRIAMLSVHSSPLGRLGSRDTGGMSVYIRSLAVELGRRGHGVDIFTRCADRAGVEREERVATNVRLVHLRAGENGYDHPSDLYPVLPEFLSALERYRVENGLCYDVIHSHYWLSGRVGQWASDRWAVPHIIMFHTLGAAKNRALPHGREPLLRLETEAELARRCDSIIAATRRDGENLSRFYGADPCRIRVIPCGVDLDLFKPTDRSRARRNLGFGKDETIVLFVGRFSPVKGLECLAEAVAHLRDIPRLRVALVGGEAPEVSDRQALEALVARSGIGPQIVFRGQVPHGDLPDYYGAADVLVLPSHYESFGLVMLEALACGTPVVATSVGAADQVILEGENGHVVPVGSPGVLAERIRRILEREIFDPSEKKKIRGSVQGFTWSAAASAVESEYARLIRSARPSNPVATGFHDMCTNSGRFV